MTAPRDGEPGTATTTSQLADEVRRRRTFAIISHPDAGKTTMTEKLLLYGGAIRQAGTVKGRRADRHAVSDWLDVERERGISVTSSVLQFDWHGRRLNLLDTPGHEDFSEDTYRTLTAVDSAIMVIDAAKGIESQTLKLFEVCRLRDIPIITFINKVDREGIDPLALLDEIAETLALDVTPVTWPLGMGVDFRGCLDLRSGRIEGAHPSLANVGPVNVDAPDADLIADRTRLYACQLVCDHLRLLPERDPHPGPVHQRIGSMPASQKRSQFSPMMPAVSAPKASWASATTASFVGTTPCKPRPCSIMAPSGSRAPIRIPAPPMSVRTTKETRKTAGWSSK